MEDLALRSAILGKRTVMYSYIVAATVVLYDAILNLPREVEYIWKRKWSVAKVLYIVCRYYGIITVFFDLFIYPRIQATPHRCRLFLYFVVAGESVPLQFVISMITIMRLYALYGRSSKFLYTILGILSVNGIGELFAAARLAQWYAKSLTIAFYGTPWATCRVMEKEVVYTTCLWVLVLAFGTLLFVLTFIRYVEGLRNAKYLGVQGALRSSWTPMIAAFYTSGTIWYLGLIVAMIIYAVICSVFSDLPRLAIIVWVAVVQSVSGSRLILDVREADQPDRVLGGGAMTSRSGTLVFDRSKGVSFVSTMFDLEE